MRLPARSRSSRAWPSATPALPEDKRIDFRIGVNLGDVIVEGDDIYGDGVNVAARLEALAEPGGVCISGTVRDQIAGKLDHAFADRGEQSVKNIVASGACLALVAAAAAAAPAPAERAAGPISNKPSIAVLPFDNMSGDPEQEYFSDGITEDIITELARYRGLFVIARNSSFAFKGAAVDIAAVGREARRALRGRGQRAQGRQARPHHRPADRRLRPAAMSGPSATTATWRTSSRSRTR